MPRRPLAGPMQCVTSPSIPFLKFLDICCGAVIPSLHHDSEAAMTGPAAVKIVLSARERSELEARVRRRTISRADAMRAEIVLLAADGLNNCAIANEIGVSR